MKRIFTLLCLALLFGCAPEPENPYGWRVDEVTPLGIDIQWNNGVRVIEAAIIDRAYLDMQACTGLQATPPIFIFTTDRVGNSDALMTGAYSHGIIYIQSLKEYPEAWAIYLIKHETIHHLLCISYGACGDDAHEYSEMDCAD